MNTLTEQSFKEFEKTSNYDWWQKLKAELLQAGKELALQETGTEPVPFYTRENMDAKTAMAHSQFSNLIYKPWLIDEPINFNYDFASKVEKAMQGGADGVTLAIKKTPTSEEIKFIHEITSSLKFLNFNFTESTEIPPLLFEKNTGTLRITTRKAWPSNDTLFALYNLMQSNLPNYRFISVSSALHNHEDISAELSKTIALAIEYIHYYTERGLSLNHVLNNIELSFTVGKNFLTEIAKLRAARLLWNRILEAYNIKSSEINTPIHSIAYPDVNASSEGAIRLTIEAMSAILGGCNSVSVIPFSSENTKFSERISRNITLLLKEESYLDKVTDPLGGAYYIEKATFMMAEKAWNQLRYIENKGGYLKSV